MVIGGSGNGEQMAANKVQGIRCALVWSEKTAALAREHNDANVVSLGGRMHTLDEMTRFVDIFLPTPFTGDERHVRRIGQMSDYEQTHDLPPLPSPRSAARLPEGHTLRRLAGRAQRGVLRAPRAVGSPQDVRRLRRPLDGSVLVAAQSAGKHLFVEFNGERSSTSTSG